MTGERSPRARRPLTALEQCAVVFALLLVGSGAYTVLRPSPGDFMAAERAYPAYPLYRYRWPTARLLTSGESQAFGVVMVVAGIGIGWAVLGTRNR